MGAMLANGTNVAKDPKQGIEYLRKSAEQGNAEAQLYYGLMLLNGEGTAKARRGFSMDSQGGRKRQS